MNDPSLPKQIVLETRRTVADGLPDGLVETYGSTGDIAAAWYTMPTTRYGHGILGDAIEAGELAVRTRAGSNLSFRLPDTEVFEDRYPRLADLDGDGTVEVVTIRSSVSQGASVTVYGLKDHALVEHASTGFIGRANRWLNIAGIASFQGGASKQIAFVRTPHIGGALYFYKFADGKLARVASMYGFSNHAIGAREMRLSAVADVDGDGLADLVLPSADRNILRMIGFKNGKLAELASAALPSRIDKAIKTEANGDNVQFLVGLGNGQVYRIGP